MDDSEGRNQAYTNNAAGLNYSHFTYKTDKIIFSTFIEKLDVQNIGSAKSQSLL